MGEIFRVGLTWAECETDDYLTTYLGLKVDLLVLDNYLTLCAYVP